MTNTDRTEALHDFGALTGVHDIARVIQRGRDPQTARFSFEMDDNTELRIGTIDNLWSQAQLGKVLAVTRGVVPMPCKPADWRAAIGNLIHFATDVEEHEGERFEDTVRDWLMAYSRRASTDREGAAAAGQPFLDGADLYVSASDFAKYLRREYSETVKLHELRQALTDLGFERRTIMYVLGKGDTQRRSSTSYYRAPLGTLDTEAQAA